jgi:hypothetical protein
MAELNVTWKGTTPLLMHSCRGVNPLDPLVKEMKKLTSKRTKTDEDLAAISNIEWELSLYWRDDVGFYIPAENIEATIKGGATANRKGKDVEKYVHVDEPFIPLLIKGKPTKEDVKTDYKYRDVRSVVVNRARVMRTRARFNAWECTFILRYDEDKIDLDDIVNALEHAGKYVGVCDYRQRYGKFTVIAEQVS